MLRVVSTDLTDPLVAPMLAGLAEEYEQRYGEFGATYVSRDNARNPSAFEPPDGALLLLVETPDDGDAIAVAGGAFTRYDGSTAEIKRVWTRASHRRRGLSSRLLAELESLAAQRGYRRIHLSTGPRQPEAVALYLAAGYTAGFDPERPPENEHPFDKDLPALPAPASHSQPSPA